MKKIITDKHLEHIFDAFAKAEYNAKEKNATKEECDKYKLSDSDSLFQALIKANDCKLTAAKIRNEYAKAVEYVNNNNGAARCDPSGGLPPIILDPIY